MPKSFDEYAADKGLESRGRVSLFFDANPGLLDTVRELRLRTRPPSYENIAAWLDEDYGYTVSGSGLGNFLKRMS